MECKIYYTSDMHGYMFPTDYQTKNETNMGLIHAMSSFEKDGNTLILDGGDTIQGSPFVKYIWQNMPAQFPISYVMNEAGYDYVTLGNHDFNYGYEATATYLDSLRAQCLLANVTDVTKNLAIKPYAIHSLENGLKVGIVGIVTDYIKVWEPHENLSNYKVEDAFTKAKQYLDEIKPQCDISICLYHGGFEADVITGVQLSDTKENVGYKICKELDYDILLSAHQHMPLDLTNVAGTYTVQLPANVMEYACLEILLEEGKLTCTGGRKVPGECSNFMAKKHLQPMQDAVEEWLDRPVGVFSEEMLPLPKLELALRGARLADFCNQVQMDLTGAEISCTSLSNNLIGFQQSVTIRDVVAAYPFPNTLKVLEVTPDILREALERCAEYFDITEHNVHISQAFLSPKIEHYNYDFFAGIEYTFDITKPKGNRVTRLQKYGKDLENRSYTLAMNNYRATGTGGYSCYKFAKVVKEFEIDIQEVIIDYIMKHEQVKLMKKPDYRIEWS
ncbi:MAG: bifunctional UDP-sugar hydrolase/5'-nucleotidase [Lachnospiraceae bacterium]